MFFTAKSLLVIVLCALLAHAQSLTASTAPSKVTPDACIINCTTRGATASNCSNYTDLPCVCTSTTFQSVVATCISQNCNATDLALAQALQKQECSTLTSNSSTTSASSTATSSSPTSSASSTNKSNAALALAVPFSFNTFVGSLVASAGALIGAAFVL